MPTASFTCTGSFKLQLFTFLTKQEVADWQFLCLILLIVGDICIAEVVVIPTYCKNNIDAKQSELCFLCR